MKLDTRSFRKLNVVMLVIALTVIADVSVARQKQRQMSVAETQDLYNQIKQTNEYKSLRAKADSVNRAQPDETPQDIDTKIKKQDSNAPDDDIFRAVFTRSVIGMPLEGYDVVYDRKKRQILSIKKREQQFKID